MSVGIYPTPRGFLNHFDFIGRSPSDHQALQESGRLPWWISPDLHMALLRPLASALGQLDHTLLGAAEHPSRMHLHSLLWWIALVSGVGMLLPLLLPLPAAGLGLLLYCLDDAHIIPVAWAANRSELIANAFVVWAVYCQLRAAQEGHNGLRVATWGLVACALLAGEHAVPGLAYAAIFASSRDFAGPQRFSRWLAPLLSLIAVYFAARRALGFGAAGLGMYIDPLADPARYAHACRERLPLLFADLTFGIAAEWYPGGPLFRPWIFGLPIVPAELDWAALHRTLGWLALAGVAGAIVGLSRATERAPRALFCLLAAAAVSLVPMCASVPMGRLTMPAILGVDAALGFTLYSLARRAIRMRSVATFAAFAAIGCMVVWVHAVSTSLRAWREGTHYVQISHLEEAWVGDPQLELGGRDVMIVSGGWSSQWVVPFVRHLRGLPLPRSAQPLSAAYLSPHRLERVADSVLDVMIPARRPAGFVGSVYRASDRPFRRGEIFQSPHFEVRVMAVEQGEPTWFRLRFPASLDSERYVFLHSTPQGLLPIVVPAVGQQLLLEMPAFPRL